MIAFRSLPEQTMEQLRNSTHPIVEMSSALSEFDQVHQGYGEGMSKLMHYLFDRGHRRIGFIYGVDKPVKGLDRINAYRQALKDANIAFDENLVCKCGPTLEDGYQAAYKFLQQNNPPTAIVATNDLIGVSTIRAGTDLGFKVPDDLSIAGFDNIPFSNFIVPRLTTIATEPEENGRAAVRLLLKRLKEPNRPREVITARWELIVRESTGSAPSL
jgi:DNA-binding LacI/PurR family transcriptional regulator